MLKYRIKMKTRISYYEYRKEGGTHVDIDLPEVESVDELKKVLRELRGPVVAPPEVGEDGMLKEKQEVEPPASIKEAVESFIKGKKETA